MTENHTLTGTAARIMEDMERPVVFCFADMCMCRLPKRFLPVAARGDHIVDNDFVCKPGRLVGGKFVPVDMQQLEESAKSSAAWVRTNILAG